MYTLSELQAQAAARMAEKAEMEKLNAGLPEKVRDMHWGNQRAANFGDAKVTTLAVRVPESLRDSIEALAQHRRKVTGGNVTMAGIVREALEGYLDPRILELPAARD